MTTKEHYDNFIIKCFEKKFSNPRRYNKHGLFVEVHPKLYLLDSALPIALHLDKSPVNTYGNLCFLSKYLLDDVSPDWTEIKYGHYQWMSSNWEVSWDVTLRGWSVSWCKQLVRQCIPTWKDAMLFAENANAIELKNWRFHLARNTISNTQGVELSCGRYTPYATVFRYVQTQGLVYGTQ